MRAILLAKLLLRNIFCCLSYKASWQDSVMLDYHCKKDLQWWCDALQMWNGAPLLWPPVNLQLFTDASGTGWGGWTGMHHHLQASGTWEPEVFHCHSNYKDFLAVFQSLQSLQHSVQGHAAQVVSDNVMTMTYLNHLSGCNQIFLTLTKNIFA